ncbi:hypothetical protein GCM10023170_022020 [Phytohabitans houttuyneae]|uniref:DUF2243 domain-containing protein n=2 Tax=Phytohabitans houttuyneae TaxID=1076126 RepID=A0A6V8K3Q3_9ACTN|nr:hypothetical protein Phou_006070 [Phytohabitans houttuyneae]
MVRGYPAGMAQTQPGRWVGSVLGPGLLLGAGLGGFVDGILLHQILRWHHLLTARRDADLTANLVADGLFHAATWFAVFGGLMWLWQRSRARSRSFPWPALIGPLLAGWGLFNLTEGLVNHHVLGLHHVRAGAHQTVYDIGFLVFGLLLAVLGTWTYRRSLATGEGVSRDVR